MTSAMLRFAARKLVENRGFQFSTFQRSRKILPEYRLISGHNGALTICTPRVAQVHWANYSDHTNAPKLSWKRPEGPPRIWRVFEGRKRSSDGKLPRFTIQDLPEHMVEDAIDFTLRTLLTEEAFTIALGIAEDPLAVEDLRAHWRSIMRQGMSIVALVESPDPQTRPNIVGVNILTVVTAQDKAGSHSLEQFKTKPVKKFFGMVFDVESEVDVLSIYGVDKYLGSVGLAAHPSFRGHGIGENILKAREDIGRAYGISVTEAIFTMRSSQISASRAGFELQLQKEYSQLLDYEGNPVFPQAKGEFIHVMTKRLY